MKSLPSVSLYIRITDEKGRRRYERIRRRNPQVCGPRDAYCLHFYEQGKRKWLSVGTDLNTASAARGQKEQELLVLSKDEATQPKPTPAAPKSLEELRTAFIHDKRTTIKKDGTPLHPNTIRSFEVVTRGFLDTIKRTFPSEVTKQDLKDWMMKLRQGDPARKRRRLSATAPFATCMTALRLSSCFPEWITTLTRRATLLASAIIKQPTVAFA